MKAKPRETSSARMTAFGTFIRRRRLTTEQTLDMVAAKCPDIPRATLGRWEIGEISTRARIKENQLDQLAAALETDPTIVRFRYARSKELAERADGSRAWFPEFCRASVSIDNCLAEEDLCPETEGDRQLYEMINHALGSYIAARKQRR